MSESRSQDVLHLHTCVHLHQERSWLKVSYNFLSSHLAKFQRIHERGKIDLILLFTSKSISSNSKSPSGIEIDEDRKWNSLQVPIVPRSWLTAVFRCNALPFFFIIRKITLKFVVQKVHSFFWRFPNNPYSSLPYERKEH